VRRVSVLAAMCLAACATTKPTAAREDVDALIVERGGPEGAIEAEPSEEHEEEVQRRVAELLAEPLTVNAAIEVAVLNNRGLAATFESLGVAQADLVQAGLLKNPMVGGDLGFSTRGLGLASGFSVSQSLLSAFLIPAQRKLAKAQLQQAVLGVAGQTLALTRDVEVAFAQVQATRAVRDIHVTLVDAAEVATELAAKQLEAGNIDSGERDLYAVAQDEAKLELVEHRLAYVQAREELNRLLGLWGEQISWTLAETKASLPDREADVSALEQAGMQQRLDLSAARFEVEAMEYALKLRRRRIVPEIEVGVEGTDEVGNDVGHEWVIGPSLAIELPIFDPGHADLARLEAQVREASHRLQQRAINARSHIRADRAALLAARERAEYLRDTVLPRRRRIGSHSMREYNAMKIGPYELLERRAEELETEAEYAEALGAYWIARAELERSVGGRLPAPKS